MGKRGPRPTGKKSYVGLFAFDYPSAVEAQAIQELVFATPAKRTLLSGEWFRAWAREKGFVHCPNCLMYFSPLQDNCLSCGQILQAKEQTDEKM
jgi:hypothetical protein